MALLHVNYFSEVLGLSTSMDVILPQPAKGQIGMGSVAVNGKLPVLYLLHGLSDDHTIWQRRTSIERYVADLPLAVVMPTVHRGFYTDAKQGYDYWTHISEEIPRIVKSFFPISDRREDTFAAGLSMGGYGALKLGLRMPDKFAAVASLSGAVDMAGREQERFTPEFTRIFGTQEELRGSDDDLVAVFERQVEKGVKLPRIMLICGTEDFLYKQNLEMRGRMTGRADLTYYEEPGTHEWGFWDRNIQRVLKWLPIQTEK